MFLIVLFSIFEDSKNDSLIKDSVKLGNFFIINQLLISFKRSSVLRILQYPFTALKEF